ncbi:MAG TPA: hypothetical protein PLS95_15590 [Thermoanaerobaculales bacterium]|nr:hypothetical protein [Thermoanaerobaculales bacterium]
MTAVCVATEAEFQRMVVDLAGLNGWWVWSTLRSDLARVNPGWPDLVLARDGEVILAELKTDKGRTTPVQRAALALLGSAVEVHLWRPSDWDEIAARLRRKPNTPLVRELQSVSAVGPRTGRAAR